MNLPVPLQTIVGKPALFVGPTSPWRSAPVLVTRYADGIDTIISLEEATDGFRVGNPDILQATIDYLGASGFLAPDTQAVSLFVEGRSKREPILIGRAPDNDVVIHSQSVSRIHAKLIPPPSLHDPWKLVDLGSRNGSRVGGQPAKPNVPMEIDPVVDVVAFGQTEFLIAGVDLFHLIVCEASGTQWAQLQPDTNRINRI